MTTASRLCAIILATAGAAAAEDIRLAVDGRTEYRIVTPDRASEVDAYAARELALYLSKITGAEFAIVSPEAVEDGKPCIFVGASAPALKRLGLADPLAKLNDQEHVTRSVGHDIFLYGKGIHGNLYAVFEFLENSLGWRWYSVFEEPVIPKRKSIALARFNRKRSFSFRYRDARALYNPHFYWQNCVNMSFRRPRPGTGAEGVPPILRLTGGMHTSFAYIPPAPDNRKARIFAWQTRRNYFETNPDFFSMNEAGKRVPRQLCFGNPALRKELTKNILEDIEYVRSIGESNIVISVTSADEPGRFCHCPRCRALEKKYGFPGGQILDYVIELCELLSTNQPGVLVMTLAYRRSQTQKPPVLPASKRLPENLVILFAPIEDCYFADWTHPDPRIQETYADLLAWRRIAAHLWCYIYPNPGGTGMFMPVGNLERIVNNMRLMAAAGVECVHPDHAGHLQRAGLSELQVYLLNKLMQDVDCDADAIVKEFTDHRYGAAAQLARTFLAELEQGRKDMRDLPPNVRYGSPELNERTFPYLTLRNIRNWQALFDRMEERVRSQPDRLVNVRLLRRELDFATLWRWLDLVEAYPDYFKDYEVVAGRIAKVNQADAPAGMRHRPLGGSVLKDFVNKIRGGGREKPLPKQFEGIDPARIRTFLPHRYRGEPATVADRDAAFGYAAVVDKPDLPFNFGFYQNDTKISGPRRKLKREEIQPGRYQVYHLGLIHLTPDCKLWFSAKSWATKVQLGECLYDPVAETRWDAYVSLKFEGPDYGGTTKENLVLCDRIILIKHVAK